MGQICPMITIHHGTDLSHGPPLSILNYLSLLIIEEEVEGETPATGGGRCENCRQWLTKAERDANLKLCSDCYSYTYGHVVTCSCELRACDEGWERYGKEEPLYLCEKHSARRMYVLRRGRMPDPVRKSFRSLLHLQSVCRGRGEKARLAAQVGTAGGHPLWC